MAQQVNDQHGNLNALEILTRAIPECHSNGISTVSSSLSGDSYNGQLWYWEDFENEVRHHTDTIVWGDHPNNLAFEPTGTEIPRGHTFFENFLSGDEKSSSSRYVQNALHMVNSVATELNLVPRFGDWKATSQGAGAAVNVPDYGCIFSDQTAHVVGEAKTPWNHTPDSGFRSWANGQDTDRDLRYNIAQTAEYMRAYQLKYGFFTSYNITYFLRQEKVNDRWGLSISEPIRYNTVSRNVDRGGVCHGKVSLRECLLYIMKLGSAADYKTANDVDAAKWTLPGKIHGSKLNEERKPPNPPQYTRSKAQAPFPPGNGRQGDRPREPAEIRDISTSDKRNYFHGKNAEAYQLVRKNNEISAGNTAGRGSRSKEHLESRRDHPSEKRDRSQSSYSGSYGPSLKANVSIGANTKQDSNRLKGNVESRDKYPSDKRQHLQNGNIGSHVPTRKPAVGVPVGVYTKQDTNKSKGYVESLNKYPGRRQEAELPLRPSGHRPTPVQETRHSRPVENTGKLGKDKTGSGRSLFFRW